MSILFLQGGWGPGGGGSLPLRSTFPRDVQGVFLRARTPTGGLLRYEHKG